MPEPIITIPIKWITDKNKQNFFPVTHLNAVRNTQNENLTVLLGRKQDMITSDNKLSWDLVDHPDLPTVNDATLTIQKNGTTVQTFTANASSNKTANITVPTSAADVNALPSSTKYGASLVLSIDSTTYVVTAQLKDQDGNNLGSAQTVDLPLESVVVSGSYDAATKKVILTLQNGSTIDFSVADLISGLQTEITVQNPLSADLITDGNTNKVYTATEKTKLSGIASGAEVNVQSDWNVTSSTSDAFIKNKPTIGNATITLQKNGTNVDSFTTNATNNKTINIAVPTKTSDLTNDGDGTNAFLTQHQDISGKQDKITSTNKLSADLISDGTTNKAYTATEKTKLNGIAAGAEVNVQSDWNVVDSSSDAFIKNKPTIGNGTLTIWQNQTSKGTFTANQNSASDITITVPTKTSDLTNDSGFLTQHQDISGKQDTLVSGTNIKTINGNSVLGSGDLTIETSSIYECTFSLTPKSGVIEPTGITDYDISCDKTPREIYEAYEDKKIIQAVIVLENESNPSTNRYYAIFIEPKEISTSGSTQDPDTWSIDFMIDVAGAKANVSGTQQSTTAAWFISAIPDVPATYGLPGQVLVTDGIQNISWQTLSALPDQTGQSGKFLTTDGLQATWSEATNITIRNWTYE